jgi:hypothetical protein
MGWLPEVTTFYYGLAIVQVWVLAYLQTMNYGNESPMVAPKINPLPSSLKPGVRKSTPSLRSALCAALMVLAFAAVSMAAELPEAPSSVIRGNAAMMVTTVPARTSGIAMVAPETKTIDKKFIALTIMSSGSTFADSYTTLFARENWLAGKKGVCNVEVESAYLYGTHPTVGRAYAVASVKSLGSVAMAYYLRKHHSRFWSAPLIANSIVSLQGVSQNMAACN